MEKRYDPIEELQNAWREFSNARNALDAEAWTSFYAEDGINIPPNLSV